jgi:hypothetical protein
MSEHKICTKMVLEGFRHEQQMGRKEIILGWRGDKY